MPTDPGRSVVVFGRRMKMSDKMEGSTGGGFSMRSDQEWDPRTREDETIAIAISEVSD
jgi:hypothetical protein